jgi:hypothetical protein
MNRRATSLALALAGCCLVACGRNQAAAPAESGDPSPTGDADTLDWRVGWLDNGCLAIGNEALEAGVPVTIVTFDAAVPYVQGRIIGRTDSAERCPPLLADRRAVNATGGRVFYLVESSGSPSVALGVGVIGAAPRKGSGVDVDGNGTEEQFTHCTTSEGISFGVWAGTPYRSTQLWKGYAYLGYDVAADCPT